MKKHIYILIGAAVVLLCLAVSESQARRVDSPRGPDRSRLDDIDPGARTDVIAHDVGNVRFTIANYGEAGNPNNLNGFAGMEFPINSGNDFLFSAGVWIGGILNGERFVSTATDGDNGTGEFYPKNILAAPFSNSSSNPDWHLSSKTLTRFNERFFALGAKDFDDDGDWNAETDDWNGDGRASKNFDGGRGLIGFDDDDDGLIDEEIVNNIDDDGDGEIDEDTDASGDANNDGNCNYDPEPHIDEDPVGDMARDYADNDFDGLVDMEDPDNDGDCCPGLLDDDGDGLEDEDGNARGVQEYYAVFTDDIQAEYVSSPDVDGHTPLGIVVTQRTYAFPEDYAADFILLDYRIRNVGPLPLRNVFIGMFADPDIKAQGEPGDAASLDDANYYDPGRLMAVQIDDLEDADGPGPGVFAMRVVKTPVALDQLRVSFRNFDRASGGDPETNADKYDMISSGDIDPISPELGDWRMLIAFGEEATEGFTIRPGETLPITVAYIAGEDTADIGVNAEWALAMYLNDFQGPSAPDAPEFAVDVYEDRTRIRWKPNAELSVDAITGEADFEGYRIERRTGQLDWERLVEYDLVDTLPGEFEWANFNYGMPDDTIFYPDGTYEYAYWDTDLIPGHPYEYAVRAFDKGTFGAGVLVSGRTGNSKSVVIARQAGDSTGVRPLSEVYVFPNPYKGGHPGEAIPNETAAGLEFVRKLFFRGLPTNTDPGKCMIRIFSLAGDYLGAIDHYNGTEQAEWNMRTRNDQEIVSGIYYFSVEYGGDKYLDKFVVIK
ncbi:MAG: fibronectin type III domain-containing protein [Calditrichaeota bacterium]|nr:fibronectin type III domain-containing protein [Calditrichota bacterium]MCB9367850.1 fibronectin type III domain-containing protein [Calditrichota bacterium]